MVVERRKLWRFWMRVGNCRRRQRVQGLANKKQSGRRLPSSLYDQRGHTVEDQTHWSNLVFDHFRHKSDRPGWDRERQRKLIHQWENWALDEDMLEYREVPLPSFEEILQARDLLKTNSAPGTDEVPPGFLACLSDDVLHNLFLVE